MLTWLRGEDEVTRDGDRGRHLSVKLVFAVVLVLVCLAGLNVYDVVTAGVPSDAYKLPNQLGVIYWHGDPHRAAVALTFDDGPNPPYTPRLLALLKANDVKATFFLVGERVEAEPALARAVIEAGHAIGNHTYDHARLVLKTESGVENELMKAETAIERATGVMPRFFRPPYGSEDRFTLEASKALGYVAVEWSVSSKDWRRPGVDAIVDNVLRQVKNGSIILMHDGGGDRSETIDAVARIIPELRRRGFEFVTIPDLLDIRATFDATVR